MLGMLLCFLAVFGVADASTDVRSVTIWTWPLSSTSPQEFAKISYDAQTMTSQVLEYSQPHFSGSADALVRVGLYDTATSQWRGVLTTVASFDPVLQQDLVLLLDDAKDVYHVGFSGHAKVKPSESMKSKAKTKSKVISASEEHATGAVDNFPLKVTLETPVAGPLVQLNKPVKVSKEGKVEEKEPEKSFLQKYACSCRAIRRCVMSADAIDRYWWAIGLFLLVQITMGGGKEGGK